MRIGTPKTAPPAPAPQLSSPLKPVSRMGRRIDWMFRYGMLLGIAWCVLVLVSAGIFAKDLAGLSLLPTITAMASLSLVALVFGQYYRWFIRPRNQLIALLKEFRHNTEVVDSLRFIGGGCEPLIEPIAALTVALRIAESRQLVMTRELGRQVARRTGPLQKAVHHLRRQATIDPLTGLYNRRMLDDSLPKLIESCSAEKTELAVLLADVDYLKALNDTKGHAAGDEFLQSIAQVLRSGLRDSDVVYRIGGDEFVVVLPATEPKHLLRTIERLTLLAGIVGKSYHLDTPPGLSVGSAWMGEMAEPTAAGLLELADNRLYEAKRSRRTQSRQAV